MWNPNGATFANKDVVGEFPRTIFVDIYNTVYVAAYKNDELLFWPEGSTSSVKLSGVKLAEYGSMFVTIDGDVYFEKDGEQGKIYKWSKNTTTTVLVKEFEELCYSLFIDIDNTLYCSVHNGAKVLATSLNDNQSDLTIVAGTGSPGLSSTKLQNPRGIFVNINFDLYVADTGNGRIQLFRSGEQNATTVAGCGTPQNLTLIYPTDVVLDADGNLYIVESHKNRIIRSGFDQHQCIVGCTTTIELNRPYSMRFDSYGNIYIADTDNHRIQKFTLVTNLCGKSTYFKTRHLCLEHL